MMCLIIFPSCSGHHFRQSLSLNNISCSLCRISEGYSGTFTGTLTVGFFSASSCSKQEAQESLLYIKSDCPGSEEAMDVLLDDEDDVPEAVEEDESKCFGSSCLERLKSQ